MIYIAILFITIGLAIKYGRMHFLIAGYNTMSKSKKENYDIEGIATVFRNGMCGMGLIIIIGYFIALWLENPQIENIGLAIALIIGLPYILFVTNSKKYKHDKN